MSGQKIPENICSCDICHRQIHLSTDTLKEEEVWLEKGDLKYRVILTYLHCPYCGKRYPVVMDDEITLTILQELREVLARRMKFISKGKSIPQRLDEKYRRINQRLDFKRRKLAEEFNGSFYQTDEGKQQLDYRYHVR